MTRWARVNDLFHAARVRPLSDRDAFLALECGDDGVLRAEVESLLAAHDMNPAASSDVTVGSRVGDYEVTGFLAAGAMGEVYRARDTKLGRDVALKILPAAFVSDPDRRARFEREARALAALNHPNIATIYGFEQSDVVVSGLSRTVLALALELVEGETLAERLTHVGRVPPRKDGGTRGGPAVPLQVDEALRIAKQIAEALEAAHEQGIIHRDLKPANIKLTRDGVVKVLDFGLAKLTSPAAGGYGVDVDVTASPTITSPGLTTGAGVLLGTPAYMSPEQVRGEPMDRRTDMWAFGCVLYEMLTGRAPFVGGAVTEVLARILEREPEWNAVPASTPANVCSLLRRCLVKERKDRLDSATVARLDIDHALVPSSHDSVQVRVMFRHRRVIVAAAIAFAFVASVSVWRMANREAVAAFFPIRFEIEPPAGQSLWTGYDNRNVAISPDGSRVVFVINSAESGDTQLVIRRLGDLDATPLEGTAGARNPFFSPDGQWVAFFAGNEMRKVSIAGGAPILVCKILLSTAGDSFTSGSWGGDDTIVFSGGGNNAPLQTVPAGGGEPATIAVPDNAKDELRFSFPAHLPGRRAVLMNVHRAFQGGRRVDVMDLDTGRRETVIPDGSLAQYVDGGYLVYLAGSGLQIVPFDAHRLAVNGDPVALPRQASIAEFSLSPGGTLVYVPGPSVTSSGEPAVRAGRLRALVWVDRNGTESGTDAPPRPYNVVRLSPDGQQAVVDIREETTGIWTWDFQRQTLSRFPYDPGGSFNPVWIPGSHRVVYSGVRDGSPGLFSQQADGAGTPGRLTTTSFVQLPKAATPDGRHVLTSDQLPTGLDIGLVSLSPPSRRSS